MSRRQLRTGDYSDQARQRLGEAVERARMAAGYRYRPEFCRHHSLSLRSLELLERGHPGVGQAFLFRVAEALPGWTLDTPRAILDGGDPPAPVAPPTVQEMAEILERASGDTAGANLADLHAEYTYWSARLRDPDAFNRLMRLLDLYHQLQVRENRHPR